MKLTRLQITRLPGIQGTIHLRDLDPGLNLITGPNAVGKSSLIRALEYLAGGVRTADPRDLVLEADFDNDVRWTVKRTASHVQWYRDGEPATTGPRLPARDELHCYWLKVEDLLAEDGQQDAALVAEIRTALAGGFDLAALRGDAFDFGPARGRKEGRELQEARQRLGEVEAENQALQRDEQDLDRLQGEVDAARQGARERDTLMGSLELEKILSERRSLEAVLAGFPKGMEKLRGDEQERLEQLDRRIDELEEEQLRIREQGDAAHRKLSRAGLGDNPPVNHERRAARWQLESVKARSGEIARQQSELVRLQAELDRACQPLRDTVVGGADSAPDIAVATLERASELAVRLRKLEIDVERLDSRIQSAGQAPEARQLDAHQQAVAALRSCLVGQPEAGASRLGMALAALGGLATAAAALWLSLWWLLAPAALSLFAAGVMVNRSVSSDGRQTRARFERSGLAGPSGWHREAVEKRLSELESDLAELQLARRRADAVSEDQAERDRLQQQLNALNEEKAELAREIGFDPALTAASVDFIARVLGQWQRAATEVAKVEAHLEQLETEQQSELQAVQQRLKAWGMSVPAEEAALDEALNALDARCEQAEAAEREWGEAEDRQRQLEQQLEERRVERRSLFARLGLDESDRNGLAERLAQLSEWRQTQDSLRVLDRREAELRETLVNAPERLQQAEAGEREVLETGLQRANEQAELLESLLQEVSATRERLRSAGKDQALESAMAAAAQARNALGEQHQQAMLAEAGQFLLDDVEAEYQNEHEPAVLADARRLFQRFTHHAFDLALDEDAGLLARDLTQSGRRRLSELSSGTRMQLLLSVRLAWTRRLEERCEPLPLFLDEALTTSDESRFREVAQNLASLAREEGRQIFYLSARQQERALWEQLAGLTPHHLDLAEIRFGQSDLGAADYRLPAVETLPEPVDESPEQWAARVGIPAIDPRQPVGGLPLFHLLRDDLALLYRLMQRYRVWGLGQLESLLNSDVAEKAIPDENWRRQLASRCAAARAWQQAWQHGRGKPVGRAALEASGAVSETFMERVCEQAESLGGDGGALIEALANKAVSGFRNDKREELAEWLEAEGYISPETPLDEEERLQRTIWRTTRAADEEETRELVSWLEAGQRV
ncbi:DNA repair exonuclease SbcCD ATPase subunit [Natronospira proteinivora]|uniref:DNA repair exonuclease SbcCD ATPase subunit n=1 Tax=Natronospira proteinivora TaxID=1807133 RepID=A0ABT1G720_9GAMM|nr:hypothetical protein [Natronospira proteinivora]MCP1727051.1 DNA repair exonuclease SbcCD ATPase subunit [Natronospira proteinivora]